MICDFAETYNIYNYRSLPARLAATLCVGLRNDSRVYKKLTDNHSLSTNVLIGLLIDDFRAFVYGVLGVKNENKSVYKILTGEYENEISKGYDTPEAFEEARKKIIERR